MLIITVSELQSGGFLKKGCTLEFSTTYLLTHTYAEACLPICKIMNEKMLLEKQRP